MINTRVRGEQCDGAFTYGCWLDSPVWNKKRPNKNPMDFGDTATVGKRLKRRYLTFHDLDMSIDFGMFLGKHNDKWIVGIVDETGNKFTAGEVFDSLYDLQEAWVLD